MVFICEYNDLLIDASDIKSSKNMTFICCDPECRDKLTYVKEYKRTIHDNISYVSAHFKHNNNKSINNCNIVKFLNSIGCDKAKQFYRKWCEPFILKSIKNCFNYNNFHILYEEIQIITSINCNKLDKIKKKESLIKNNEKLIWILQINSFRPTINNWIIKRNYSNNETKYYLTSENDYYYDFNLYDFNISEIYLDFNYKQIVKLIKNCYYLGFEVELIDINDFINKFNKIKKIDYEINNLENIKIKSYNIHIEIYNEMQRKFNIMNNTLLQFKKKYFIDVNHENSKKYHDIYLVLKNNCNITTLEYYQNEIYNDFNNIFYIDYSYNCLNFICEIYNCSYYNFLLKYINCDNCAKYIINNFNDKPIKCMIKCDKCIESENIKNLYYEKLKLKSIEKNRRNNKIIEKQEHKKLLKLEKESCKCNILLINICTCEIPIYELIKLSNSMFCINCNKWKCRCK